VVALKNTQLLVCNLSKCVGLVIGLGTKIEGLGLEKITEGLGLVLASDLK